MQREGGVTFLGLLFLLFLGLKLGKVIDWSWWWVFAPFWIPVAAFLILCVFAGLYGAIADRPPRRSTRK